MLRRLNCEQFLAKPIVPFLARVYACRPFRTWFGQTDPPSKECAASLRYRQDKVNLSSHVAGHRRALQHVEDAIFADMAAAAEQHSEGTRDSEEAMQLAKACSDRVQKLMDMSDG